MSDPVTPDDMANAVEVAVNSAGEHIQRFVGQLYAAKVYASRKDYGQAALTYMNADHELKEASRMASEAVQSAMRLCLTLSGVDSGLGRIQ